VRVKDQGVDGVCAAVLFLVLGIPLFQLRDNDLQQTQLTTSTRLLFSTTFVICDA
jgi:hypothetical protein